MTRSLLRPSRRGRFEALEPRMLLAAESLGLGNGLAADYYSDANLTNLAATRIDPQINFNWAAAAPVAALPADGFSVRWNGKVQAQYSETYTFYADTAADDGVRVTISTSDLTAVGGLKANRLIDTWSCHTAVEQSGSLALIAGETYNIVVEYYNNSGNASLALSWKSPSTPKATVPAAQLYPTQSLAVNSISGTWLNSDLGSPALAGSFTAQGSACTLTGGGTGIGGTSDQCQFAYQVLQGDGIGVVKVSSLSAAGSPGAQAGLMVRDGTAAGGLFAGIFITPGGGVNFSYRATASAAAVTTNVSGIAVPYWLKLVRHGPTINGYVSSTGADDSWTFVARADITGFSDAVLLGLAATSASAAATVSATLGNVALSTDIPLGANLGGYATYSGTFPFIDLVKGGCGLAMSLDTSGNPTSTAATLDANGWPTQDFAFQGPYMQKADGFTGQTFTLTFTGKAAVTLIASVSGTATAANDSVYTSGYDAVNNVSKWYLKTSSYSGGNDTGICPRFRNTQRTAASATGTGLTNVQLLQAGYTSYDPQHVFTQEWLDEIKVAKVFRTMDWSDTNFNTAVNWSQRTLPSTPEQYSDYSATANQKGMAWEYIVQACNLAHRDLWLNVPDHASNDYILKLAQLVCYGSDGVNPYTGPQANPVYSGLAPDLNVYVEYSNEAWNYSFEAYTCVSGLAWAAYQAGTRYGSNQVTLGYWPHLDQPGRSGSELPLDRGPYEARHCRPVGRRVRHERHRHAYSAGVGRLGGQYQLDGRGGAEIHGGRGLDAQREPVRRLDHRLLRFQRPGPGPGHHHCGRRLGHQGEHAHNVPGGRDREPGSVVLAGRFSAGHQLRPETGGLRGRAKPGHHLGPGRGPVGPPFPRHPKRDHQQLVLRRRRPVQLLCTGLFTQLRQRLRRLARLRQSLGPEPTARAELGGHPHRGDHATDRRRFHGGALRRA